MISSVSLSAKHLLGRSKGLGGRYALLAGLIAAFSGIAFWAGSLQADFNSEAYARQRLPLINAKLSEAAPGFVFLAGDSHAELFNATYRLCGREMVNGGMSGAKAELYREMAPQLAFVSRPAMAILSIGTNNLLRKKKPLDAGPRRTFEENVAGTVAALRKTAPRVLVLAVPPIGPEAAGAFEIKAVAAYSESLRNLCAREGCEFADPYAELREPDGSTARPGTLRDEVHLLSYRAAHDRLGALLCPGGSL